MAEETTLNYMNFNKIFEIHTDTSDRQLDEVISQNRKPLAFYSRKLSNIQRNYIKTKQELLNIFQTIETFMNILFGQRIKVFIDHKNLVHELELEISQRAMIWRSLLEVSEHEIEYNKGPKNTIADALSRLHKKGNIVDDESDNLWNNV